MTELEAAMTELQSLAAMSTEELEAESESALQAAEAAAKEAGS